jgi:uncharacterized Fe-S cluster-containing radical SAM superfamily protein
LCNFNCRNCYVESSPLNDRLAYLTAGELRAYLDEIERDRLPTVEIGFTGGEPFMNRDILTMLEDSLSRGFRALVLTNAATPMRKLRGPLFDLTERYGEQLVIRVSLDHYTPALHELERGPGSFAEGVQGLGWLVASGFEVRVAGRTCWNEPLEALREGYARLFRAHGIPVDAFDPEGLVLFPEMNAESDVPEITEKCWSILGVDPGDVMCATSRMVAKRTGAERPVVLSCTLIAYDPAFEMGRTLAEAAGVVTLNHPHCARFCVLGGGSCSRG